MHLSEKDLEGLREALEEECVDIEEQLAQHGKKVDGDWQGTAEGFNVTEPEPEDAADKMEELATNVALVESLEARLKDVVDALAKMDEGTYGICERTGEKIPLARLKANPAARTTIE